MSNADVPIWEKYTLTIDEAAKYFRIGEDVYKRQVWDTSQQAIFNRRTAGREGENTEKGTLFLCLLRNFIPYYLCLLYTSRCV